MTSYKIRMVFELSIKSMMVCLEGYSKPSKHTWFTHFCFKKSKFELIHRLEVELISMCQYST